MGSAPPLLFLPREIIIEVLSFVDPEDLAAVSGTCQLLHSVVRGNRALWKSVYLLHFDAPPNPQDMDWESEMHDWVKLLRVCGSQNENRRADLPFVLATVSRLLHHSARVSGRRRAVSGRRPQPRNSAMLGHLFECNDNTDTFLCGSFLFERAKGLVTHFHDPPQEEHQMSAKLHCLYGVPVLKCGRTRSSAMYPFACSKVYDLRQYSDNSRWGPFMNDGSDRVDWEKVEAILIIIYHNIRAGGLDKFPVFYAFWRVAFAGSWPGSYEPMHLPLYHLRRHDDEDSCADHFDDDGYPAPAPAAASSSTDAGVSSSHPRPVQLPIRSPSSLGLEDPYGVSGTWIRMVCFLDYNDFFAFNFPITDALPDNVPRPSLDIGEATRLILMKIHVSRIEPPGPEDGQALPVVHFKGTSRSLDGESANSDLRGSCRLTREGEVRWTTFSIVHGQERWRSESVQIGGVRSGRGVVGNWFDTDYDPQGPCGPTAFWKVCDRLHDGKPQQLLAYHFLPLLPLVPPLIRDFINPPGEADIHDDTEFGFEDYAILVPDDTVTDGEFSSDEDENENESESGPGPLTTSDDANIL